MIKTVIFDLDGLLIQSEMVAYYLYKALLQKYGYSFELDDYAKNYCGGTAKGNMTAVIQRFNLPITVQEGFDFIYDQEAFYVNQGIPLHKGARELLAYLKQQGYQIILATSSIPERANKTLKLNHIDEYFSQKVFGSDVARGKPFPDIFLKAVEKSGNKAEECLILEDSENGIKAAHGAHVKVICIPDLKVPSKECQEVCECMLDSLEDVIRYLENA